MGYGEPAGFQATAFRERCSCSQPGLQSPGLPRCFGAGGWKNPHYQSSHFQNRSDLDRPSRRGDSCGFFSQWILPGVRRRRRHDPPVGYQALAAQVRIGGKRARWFGRTFVLTEQKTRSIKGVLLDLCKPLKFQAKIGCARGRTPARTPYFCPAFYIVCKSSPLLWMGEILAFATIR